MQNIYWRYKKYIQVEYSGFIYTYNKLSWYILDSKWHTYSGKDIQQNWINARIYNRPKFMQKYTIELDLYKNMQ